MYGNFAPSSYSNQQPQYPQYQQQQQHDDRYNQPSVKRASQQQSSQQGPPGSGGNSGDPTENKIMVLYIIPNDPTCVQAWQLVSDYPEILVQDARLIMPRPSWLNGVPTVVHCKTKAVYQGASAMQAVSAYVQNLRAMSGPQNVMVVPTVDPNSGFQVADRNNHYKACADDRPSEVPLGTTTRTAMTVGQVDASQFDDPRYYATEKGVSESALNAFIAAREQKRQPNVTLRPSVLDNGEMVTM